MTRTRAPGPRMAGPTDVSGLVLWYGALGGMGAWTLHLGGTFAAVPWICATGQTWLFHLLTAGAGLVAGGACVAAAVAYRRTGEPAEDLADVPRSSTEPGPSASGGDEDPALKSRARSGVDRFLAVGGLVLSGFFLLLILAEGLPAVLKDTPCRYVPTLDLLIVMGEGWGGSAAALLPFGFLARGRPFPALLALLLAAPEPVAAHGRGPVGPGELWDAWNWDPWLLSALAAATILYVTGLRRLWSRAGRGGGIPRWRAVAYLAGIGALVLALVSPIDAVGETLFSVHMVQHLLLMVVAAPLLVLGRPALAYLWGTPVRWRRLLSRHTSALRTVQGNWRRLTHPVVVLVLHVAALWAWHVPRLYEAALEIRWVHHLEHATFFFTALLFWWALANAGRGRRNPSYGAAVLYVFGTALQSGALGALITFAPEPWYPAHEPGVAAWGISLLVDQQLAGILMWVPVGLIYAAASVALFVAWLGEAERTVARRETLGWQTLPGRTSADPGPHGSAERAPGAKEVPAG